MKPRYTPGSLKTRPNPAKNQDILRYRNQKNTLASQSKTRTAREGKNLPKTQLTAAKARQQVPAAKLNQKTEKFKAQNWTQASAETRPAGQNLLSAAKTTAEV